MGELEITADHLDEAAEKLAPPLTEPGDMELLREYAATGSNAPFAKIVARHVNWVHTAALRQSGSHAAAQDITQAVFIILARKASSLQRETVLSGWLFRAVRYAVLDSHKMETRRQNREQEAARMELTQSETEDDQAWEQMRPILDDAVAQLGAKDRHAVLLRFFEKKSFGEIGAVLGGNENSARVRVVRAVEKLRDNFRKRGVALPAVLIGGVLLGQAVKAAPTALASSVAGQATTPDPTALLVEANLRRLLWRRLRLYATIAGCLLLLLLGLGLWSRQSQASRAARLAAEQTATAQAIQPVLVGIDRAYTLNDPNAFVALIYFRPDEERFRSVLLDYVRAQAAFRQEMKRVFNVQQRAFNVTFNELCIGQPSVGGGYIGSDHAATNIMTARYPFHLVKVGQEWKWDLFGGLSPDVREQRMAILQKKAQLLDTLGVQIRNGKATNVTNILEMVKSPRP